MVCLILIIFPFSGGETMNYADNSSTGKFVSESKFAEDPATFIPHILQRNSVVLQDLITKPEVEKKLLLRLRKKAATYAQDIVDGDSKDVTSKIDVDGVVDLYESYIIPLTKEVEVRIFFDLFVA
jgi:chorismate mutase